MTTRTAAAVCSYRSVDVTLVFAALSLARDGVEPANLPAETRALVSVDVTKLDVEQALSTIASQCVHGRDACLRVLTNHTVATVLNMSYKGMAGQEALKVLKFLLMRGPEHFDLARRFILQNRLRRTEVAQLLSALFVEAAVADEPSVSKHEEMVRRGAWVTWGRYYRHLPLARVGVLCFLLGSQFLRITPFRFDRSDGVRHVRKPV